MASATQAAPNGTIASIARGAVAAVDAFLPDTNLLSPTDAVLLRSFVALHLIGPLLGLILCGFMVAIGGADWVVATFTGCVALFWLFPFAVKRTGRLDAPAFASVQLLAFVSLFGAFHYGGFNSPFAPWLVVAVLLTFLYAPRRIGLCLAAIAVQLALFGFILDRLPPPPARISPGSVAPLFIASVVAATLYTSIISVFYTQLKKQGSALALEAARHRATALQLRDTMAEARAANQQKSAFLARVSHELRTPLNVVIGYSEMLVEDAALDEHDREQDLRRITEASRHLLSLVNQVVDLAHVESDNLDVELKPFDVDDFFARLSDSVTPLVARNGNRLVIEKEGPLAWMNGDPLKLRQCLLNLISNAGKFTRDGSVTLAAARRRNSLGGSIVFEVRDTGIGMDETEVARLFEPYRQASADTARQFGGSGLGLALTKRFCTLMGGSIAVTSAAGRGSAFRITLPVGLAAEAARTTTPPGAASRETAGTIP